jgi:hypothetical protein
LQTFLSVIRTSEFWVGLAATVLAFLVAQGVISQQVSDFVNMAIVYIVGRLISKVVRAAVPPQP